MTPFALFALLYGSDCPALAPDSIDSTISSLFLALMDLLKAAVSTFFLAIWEFLKACRHSLDEECLAIEERAGVSRFVLHACPDTVAISTIGLVVPRWLYEWGYLVFIATVLGFMLLFKFDIGRVMPGRGQRVVNAINGVDRDVEE